MKPINKEDIQNYITTSRQKVVDQMVFRFGKQMYDYQLKLLQRYIDCKEKQLPSCNKFQNHPAIKLQIAERIFSSCIDIHSKHHDIFDGIDECSKQFEKNVEDVFEKQFLECEHILKQY